MKSATLSALFFAASIALAVAVPARNYYYEDDEYPEGQALLRGRPVSLASSPFYYQPRTLELDELPPTARKYQIVKKKKKPGQPGSGSDEDEEEEEDDEESSEEDEEEDDEENNEEENNEEESMDVPPWEELFPEEDKNTGTFDTPADSYGGGQGGQGGPPQGEGGAPAPSNSGSLLSLLTGGYSGGGSGGNSNEGPGGPGGPQNDGPGGPGGPPQYRRQGPPPQHSRQGPPPKRGHQGPPPPYQAVRARTSIPSSEEPRSGGAVLYDGVRYIPVKPVHVRVPKRQAKKIKTQAAPATDKARSLVPAAKPKSKTTTRQQKKISSSPKKPQYVLVPVERDSREIRFARDQHGFRIDSGPMFGPTEVWRWEGPGGRPLRRRENRPSGLYYAPRPQRGSASTIRFAEESDY